MTQTTCPHCGAAVAGDAGFGMVTCLSCGELVMLEEAKTSEPQAPSAIETADLAALPLMPDFSTDSESEKSASKEVEDFKDVEAFANSELPSPGFGGLVYDLRIQGVDSPEQRQDVLDILSDQRLGLDVTSIAENIEDGVLKIEEINPVKASVILNRLRPFSLDVTWISKQLVKVAVALSLFCGFAHSSFADEWSKHEANLNNYAGRINSLQEELHDLIVRKNQNKDPSKRDALLEEIKKKDEALKVLYQSYRDEKDHILYEHPEQGDTSERKYRHVKMKTLEEMENESGVDGQLSRLKVKVEEAYPKH